MARLSKEDRKRLREEAEHSLRFEEYFSHVVSPNANADHCSAAAIVEHASQVGVALEHVMIDEMSHAFRIPNADSQLAVAIGYTTLSPEIILQAESYECLFDDVQTLRIGVPTITLRAKVNFDPAVDFLHQTMLRVLGRLTHGILISGTGEYVGDDWLAWSLDYGDPDMFNADRVYDDAQPDFRALLDRFPQLRFPIE